MTRSVPFEPKLTCSSCGFKGASDFQGTVLCPGCAAVRMRNAYSKVKHKVELDPELYNVFLERHNSPEVLEQLDSLISSEGEDHET